MQFAIPQFVEVEDKVIGPLTVRQFLFLVAGGIFLLICWSLADLSLFIFLTVITVAVTGSFAFVKINGRPFQIFLVSVFQFFSKPRLRVWFREPALKKIRALTKGKKPETHAKAKVKASFEGKRLVKSQLVALSSSLDQEMVAALEAQRQENS